MRTASSALGRFRVRLRRLFYGHRPAAIAFQAGLLAIDLAAIAYFVATTFVADAPWMRMVDLLLGGLLTLEFLGRMLAHRHPMRYIDNSAAVIDLVVIASLFVSALGGNLGFLRILRTVRLLRSYNVLGRLKKQFPVVRRNEEVILAALNLAVFVFMISALVFVTQHGVNPKIEDFLDALYGRDALHHRLRGRHTDWQRQRRVALDCHDARGHHPVPPSGAGCLPPGRQGALPLPAVWVAAP